MDTTHPALHPESRRLRWAGYLLGFAMGGFFDGILLHQILQWHHLLSGLTGGPWSSLAVQVTVDGLFHALMYLIAAAGLVLLFGARAEAARPGMPRLLWAAFWIGFGLWHAIDAVFSHWITGIHRIKMDAGSPLAWDIAWLAVFGVIPLLLGLWLRRNRRPPAAGGAGPRVVASLLAAGVLAAGAANVFPLRSGPDTTVVALRPGVPAAPLFDALDGTEGRVVWADPRGSVWVLRGVRLASVPRLYGAGAMYVSGSAAPEGCAAWLVAGAAD